MDNPLAELAAWWEDAYDDGGAGTVLLDFRNRFEMREDSCIETLLIEFESRDDQDARAAWRLEIDDCLEMAWRGPGSDFTWLSNHPLLFPYRDRWSRISYAKPFEDRLRVWGAVAMAHRHIVGHWFPLSRYFREEMIEQPFGILAEGPERLIGSYAEALSEIGADIEVSTNNFLFASIEKAPPATVVTWNDSYFVAREFQLTRIP